MTSFTDLEGLPANSISISARNLISVEIPRYLAGHAHWFLRATLASVFIYHGVLKLADLGGYAAFLELSVSTVLLVALAETVGGAFVLLGGVSRVTPAAAWVTRLGAAMILPVMAGAIVMVHWGQWNFLPSQTHPIGGIEFQVVLLLVSLYFVVKGNNA